MLTLNRSQHLLAAALIAALPAVAAETEPAGRGRLSVAVPEADIEAIVSAVGGDQVDTFSLFSGCGGPPFAVCKRTPGLLPQPALLLEPVKQMRAQVVLLDPATPPEYGRAFREEPGLTVVEAPSSIAGLPGQKSYSALFEHLVQALVKAHARE